MTLYDIVTFLKHFNPIFFWHHCEGHGADIHFCQETWQELTPEVHLRKT